MWSRGVVFLVALSLAACQSDRGDNDLSTRVPNPTPSSTETRIVGLVGTMTGPDSWRGGDAFEGADLAVHVLNRSLNEDEPPYELVTLDDRGSASQATLNVKQLARSSRTVGIVYAGPPEGLPPAERALARGGMPAILCYGDLYSARLLSPHVFQESPSFLWEARRIVDYLLHDRGYRRIGMLATDDLTGTTARRALLLALREEGGRLAVSRTFGPNPRPVQRLMNRLRYKKIEALVVEASPPFYGWIQEHLAEHGGTYKSTHDARAELRRGYWAPQIVGFDTTVTSHSKAVRFPPGTIAADSYARGVHYLPVPNFERFTNAFESWWGEAPLGWERRAYDAVSMIGWATRRGGRTGRNEAADLAPVLEKMDRVRFSGLDITFGPDDHTAVDQSTVGLWVIPRPAAKVREAERLPDGMPWVPLARGFSIDGERTDVLPQDWKWLFRNAPPPKAPAPRLGRSKFGVTTPKSDPVH